MVAEDDRFSCTNGGSHGSEGVPWQTSESERGFVWEMCGQEKKVKVTLKMERWLIYTQHSSCPMKLPTLREVAEWRNSGWVAVWEYILKSANFL